MTEKILITDRTSIETDWLCGMKYWWYKLEGGGGVVPNIEAIYFKEGREIHDYLARIVCGEPWQDVLASIPPCGSVNQADLESWQRMRGWIVGFGMWIWPRLVDLYEPVLVEKELIIDRTPLWIACTPDLILRGKSKKLLDMYGKLVYKDYKSVKRVSGGWMAHWPYAVQVHLGLLAVEEELNEKIGSGSIMALTKGEWKYGRLSHPYVWGYKSGDVWRHDYKYGWDHAPVWDYPGGIEKWVLELGEDLGTSLFPSSAPIFMDPRLLEALIRERTIRQREIEDAKEASKTDLLERERHFPHRFMNCKPVIGSPCPYLDCCFNREVGADPLASGLYVPRTPHHDVEVVGEEEE